MDLVLTHQDGSTSQVSVNGSSTLRVQTWRPPTDSQDEGTMPVLTEDQTFALHGVTAVDLLTDTGYQEPAPDAEPLTDEEAARLEREAFGNPDEAAPAPWAED